MDLQMIEYAAQKFFEMCRLHPDICPHDYHWCRTYTDRNTGIVYKYYVCGLCGQEIKQVENENK